MSIDIIVNVARAAIYTIKVLFSISSTTNLYFFLLIISTYLVIGQALATI